ncbi:MAG TPA: galactosyldiacylglycerol synthase, partial [Variovorax sp.]|nr:galactosyldiacylglycerol synthase [Variovorax sp.]
MTKILILSVSAGNGHVRAAQALEAAVQASPPHTAVHIDAMAHVAGGFRKVYTDWYIQLVNRAPELWSYLHQRTDATPHHAPSQRLR